MKEKKEILLVGHLAYDPLGRHILSFMSTLLQDKNNIIYLDKGYLGASVNRKDKNIILRTMFARELRSGQLRYDIELPYNYHYDFVIFTDSISNDVNQHYEQTVINRNANIKICYPVFDGSMPPLNWIKIINQHFDICITPSEYCAHNLKRYGVMIDCFGLDCGILLDDFLDIKPNLNEKMFRFGSIGASDFRKNIPLLIQNFAEVFSKNDKVELYIHSSYGKDIQCQDEIIEVYNKYKNKANIILKTEKISQNEMTKLWASFDAYVSPQTTTGYFTTPAEACATGIPTILSDISVHKELTKFIPEKDNLFFVPHNKLSLAFHWAFNYRSLGCKFDAENNAYKDILKYVYEHRKELSTAELIAQRKCGAQKLTFKALATRYNALVGNRNIVISDRSHIENDNFFMSTALLEKYKKYHYGTIVNISDNFITTTYSEEKSDVFRALEKGSFDAYNIYLEKSSIECFENEECQNRTKIKFYLFNFINIFKIKKTSKRIEYYLFGFIPIMKIKISN